MASELEPDENLICRKILAYLLLLKINHNFDNFMTYNLLVANNISFLLI